jgi:hypothetical protein
VRPEIRQTAAFLPPFVLRIVWVPNLEPIFTIRRIPALRYNPFEILVPLLLDFLRSIKQQSKIPAIGIRRSKVEKIASPRAIALWS